MSKKAAKPQKEFRQYATGDPVLGKVRGYPPWPGVVVDPADAPPAVLNEQPPGKKAVFHCILFFPMGDYAWLHSKDLSSLKKHEIEAFLADDTKKRNGDLREGYKIALDPEPWMTNLQESRQAAQENSQVDELASENDEEDGGSMKKAKAATKKRKRESDAEPPKKATKAKKAPAEPTKKKSAASTKGKKNGGKSKATVESEDDGEGAEGEDEEENAGPSKKTSPPPAKKVKRDKEEVVDDAKDADPQSLLVREWRHKLQKTFLSNKAPPKAEAMPELDALFTTVETYEGMTIEQLQFSKIGKVMRHVASLVDDKIPPRDDEYKFRARAKGLVDKWHQILNANKAANGSPTASGPGQTNGKPACTSADKKDEEDVTNGTEKLDLNGKDSPAAPFIAAEPPAEEAATGDADQAMADSAADAPAEDEQDAPAEADTSIVGDVTMSEA